MNTVGLNMVSELRTAIEELQEASREYGKVQHRSDIRTQGTDVFEARVKTDRLLEDLTQLFKTTGY